MHVKADIHLHADDLHHLFNLLFQQISQLTAKVDKLMLNLDDLIAKAAAEKTVIAGFVVTMQGLVARLGQAGSDPVKLQALSDAMTANTDALSEAIASVPPNPSA